MGQIIRERERKTSTWYCIDFYAKGELCSGYDCDKDGNILKDKINPCAYNNYLKDVANPNLKHCINKYSQSYTENALFRCDCGEEFELCNQYLGACQCDKCGKYFNLFGQELTHPSNWNKNEDW